MMPQPVWISDAEVDAILSYPLALKAVEQSLVAQAHRNVDQPLKPYVRPGGRENEYERGRLIVMPAWVGDPVNAIGTKLISSVCKNLERGLPRASGLVILNDVETGIPFAIMDCTTLSARRTASVAALSWHHLGSPGDTIALVGAGPINKEAILAIDNLPGDVGEFRLFDLNHKRAEALCASLAGRLKCRISASHSLDDCLNGATTVIAATTGSKRYITPAQVKACHLFLPLSLEDFCPNTLLSADKVIVDDFDQCAREEKMFHHLVRDGRITRDRIYAELGQIVAGMKRGRAKSETIYCNLMGMAVEDVAVAKAVFDEFVAK
jgi:ornithine cyclodeaminase/alanine dehydrogenase-like protein (mu-crystallin family)